MLVTRVVGANNKPWCYMVECTPTEYDQFTLKLGKVPDVPDGIPFEQGVSFNTNTKRLFLPLSFNLKQISGIK